jgi:hypothetical protein
MTYIDEARAIGPRSVWQITPPSDYRDRMAQDGAPQTPPGGYPLTDHGGSTIPTPKLVLVTLGSWWGDLTKLQAFAQDLMTAGYLQPLADYKYGSGQGSFLGLTEGPLAGGTTVTDAQLQDVLARMIDGQTVPAPDANTLYALLLPEGVTVDSGGSASCSAFCGYHDAFTHASATVYYTVQTATDCQGCNEGDPFAAFCAVLAHEVAEACTDAVPGQGWYNDQTGMENADEWAWQFFAYGPWTVQGYQVNGVGNSQAVIKYAQPSQPNPNPNPNPNPDPNPNPKPQPDCRATADAQFTALTGLVNDALQLAQRAGNPKAAAWYTGGLVWLAWTQESIDAALSQTVATAGLPVVPQEHNALEGLADLLEQAAIDLRSRLA